MSEAEAVVEVVKMLCWAAVCLGAVWAYVRSRR